MLTLEMTDLGHRYPGASQPTLSHIRLEIEHGESVAVVGPSGGGKSTLLAVAALLTPASSGRLRIEGTDVGGRSQAALTAIRRSNVGILFQDSHLIRHLTVIQNILVPALASRLVVSDDYAWELLEFVGLEEFADRLPGTLSGGQAQRVALCRALANRPRLLVADEPTASLDAESAALIRDMLSRVRMYGASVLVATHDLQTAAWADRVLHLRAGVLHDSVPEGRAR